MNNVIEFTKVVRFGETARQQRDPEMKKITH